MPCRYIFFYLQTIKILLMRKLFLIILTASVSFSVYPQDLKFTDNFKDNTMRLDYNHSGTSREEHFAVQEILSDGIWAGSKSILVDSLQLGIYFFEIHDRKNGKVLYSRGFSSLFAEWQTTPEAHDNWNSFPESMRFPWPIRPVVLILKKRDNRNRFEVVWNLQIDPDSRHVIKADIQHQEKIDVILQNGAPSEKIDLVILGDGYSSSEMEKFQMDANRLTSALLNAEPFKSRKGDFNIRAVETPSAISGISKPHHNIYKRSFLSAEYSSFDSERYVLSSDNSTIRNAASAVPYDFMVILVNEKTYGGGGIYNLYTTVSADNLFADYIMIHELGHHMAALADEYYTSSVAYEAPDVKFEPWETNITTITDRNNLKWKDLVDASTPIPTKWNKPLFDNFEYKIQKSRDSLRAVHVEEQIMENLFTSQLNRENEFFSIEKFRDVVGAFEGAGYAAKGMYRPQVDCIMFSRHMKYCRVCSRSLEKVFDEYVK
jgi:hypothetical protein